MAVSSLFFSTCVLLLSSLFSTSASASEGRSGDGSLVNLANDGGKLLSTMVGVQGLIYCKRGSKLIPIEGAVARVTCETTDEFGYEAEDVSVLSQATDAKGYFLATLSPSEMKEKLKIKECRAYLELSPLETCNFPTEINRGISGAILASYRVLLRQKMKLFTVGPFVFAPEETQDKSIPNGY